VELDKEAAVAAGADDGESVDDVGDGGRVEVGESSVVESAAGGRSDSSKSLLFPMRMITTEGSE
jgi:hypothetical protein